MGLRINDIAPDFTASSTAGEIKFHDWLDGHYGIIFSHPRDFTPVCTTEFGAVAQLAPEWKKRNTKVIGVSVDSVADHEKWKRDIEAFSGAPAEFPIIDDTSLTVSKAYDMLPADFYLPTEGRTPANSATVRTVYIIGPDKKIRLTMSYPMSVGRNFAEILRALDAVQATDGVPFATPANWVPGQDVIVALSVTTLDNRLSAKLEPRASAPHRRLQAIRRLSEAGVPTGVMFAPVIPAVNDAEMEAVLAAAREAGAGTAGMVLLRLPHEVAPIFRGWLEAHLPERAGHVMSLVNQARGGRDYDARFGQRQSGTGEWARLVGQRFDLATRRLGYATRRETRLDCSQFIAPRAPGPQGELF